MLLAGVVDVLESMLRPSVVDIKCADKLMKLILRAAADLEASSAAQCAKQRDLMQHPLFRGVSLLTMELRAFAIVLRTG